MKLLDWNPAYELGIPSVDIEHREMIDMINQAHAGLEERRDPAAIEAMLGEIHASIAAHFALEEVLMRTALYPEYSAHKDDHERLLEQIRDLMDDYVADAERGRSLLQQQLSDWFGRHFRSHDARLHGKLTHSPPAAND